MDEDFDHEEFVMGDLDEPISPAARGRSAASTPPSSVKGSTSGKRSRSDDDGGAPRAKSKAKAKAKAKSG
eukprot:11186935-Alexandrium_andersonii.AAC.1